MFAHGDRDLLERSALEVMGRHVTILEGGKDHAGDVDSKDETQGAHHIENAACDAKPLFRRRAHDGRVIGGREEAHANAKQDELDDQERDVGRMAEEDEQQGRQCADCHSRGGHDA